MKLFTASCLLFLSLQVHGAPTITAENVETFFNTAFAVQRQEHRIAGAVVSVVYQGKPVFKGGYGYADIDQRIPANAETSLFRVASITKTFIWTAIMQLHERGKLDINDDVNDYLTVFKIPDTFQEPIRIRHLLSHTAGLEESAMGMSARNLEEMKPLAQYLQTNMPARVRPPGIHASYSNWGASLAGYIVEQASGQSWSDYIDANILTVLDMKSTNTQNNMSEPLRRRHAKGYRFTNGEFIAAPFEVLNDAPAGNMSTTADDMSRFMLAHLADGQYNGQQLLKPATAREMQSILFDVHGKLPPLLHGFYRSDQNGQVIFGHGGDINQFHSDMALFPELGLGLFVSFNSDPSAAARSNLVPAFVDYFFPREYLREAPEPKDMELTPYVGQYIPLRSNQSTIERLATLVQHSTISIIGANLSLAGYSQWVPVGIDEFVHKYQDTHLVFKRNEAGLISHAVIGSPLGTYRKVTGLQAPDNQRNLILVMMIIALATVAGFGYRAFVPSRDVGLPSIDVIAAWLHALFLLYLYSKMYLVLSGDMEQFSFGMPEWLQRLMLAMTLNLLLGIYVVVGAIRQWGKGSGTLSMRVLYSLVGLMALINLWICWYFNIVSSTWY
jgi:CubicO group peptidase (beta-lactamase class C family)